MPLPRYLPHLIYSTALISITLHLMNTKDQAAVNQAHARARISILENINDRLRSGEDVSDAEIARLRRIARENLSEEDARLTEAAGMRKEQDVDWKTVIFGRRAESPEQDGQR